MHRAIIFNCEHLATFPIIPQDASKRQRMPELSKAESLTLLAISAACLGIIANTFVDDGQPLIASLALSGIAFAFTYSLIRWLGDVFLKAGLKGRDMSKIRKTEMYVPDLS